VPVSGGQESGPQDAHRIVAAGELLSVLLDVASAYSLLYKITYSVAATAFNRRLSAQLNYRLLLLMYIILLLCGELRITCLIDGFRSISHVVIRHCLNSELISLG